MFGMKSFKPGFYLMAVDLCPKCRGASGTSSLILSGSQATCEVCQGLGMVSYPVPLEPIILSLLKELGVAMPRLQSSEPQEGGIGESMELEDEVEIEAKAEA